MTDASNNERLIGVEIEVIGSAKTVQTNVDGRFLLDLDLNEAKILSVYLKGYQRQHITIIEPSHIDVTLERIYSQGFRKLNETGMLEAELLNTEYSIDHISGQEILEMPNGPGVDGLSNFHSIYASRPEDRMLIWDFRGFASTEFSRALTIADGIDISIPDMGSAIDKMTTPTEIDISSIELRSSPAATLMGSGAYSGVVAHVTKTPWQQRGLTVAARGATGCEVDLQARFAQLLDKKQRFGVKLTGQFNRLDANLGNNKSYNTYGEIDDHFQFDQVNVARHLGLDSAQTESANRYFGWANTLGNNALLGQQRTARKGFTENEIADQQTRILKLGGALYFKIDPRIRLNYQYKMSYGTGIYQAESRFNFNNFLWQQHSIVAEGKHWEIAAHGTFSHSGNSYNLQGVANSINESGRQASLKNQFIAYLDTVEKLSDGFSQPISDLAVDQAFDHGRSAGNSGWFVPSTQRFDSIAEVAQNGTSSELTSLKMRSSSQGIKGKYLFDLKWLDAILGVNFKRESPGLEGNFYMDTLGELSFVEVGGSAMISSSFFRERFNVKLGLRVTKNELFDTQLSPNGSISFRVKNHFVWAGFQSGFRNPNYWELYRQTFDGAVWHLGNANGYNNRLAATDMENVRQLIDEALNGNAWPTHCPDGDLNCLYSWVADSLSSTNILPLQPERVKSVELGYRSVVLKHLFVDVTGHCSWHHNRIYYTTVSRSQFTDMASAAQIIGNDSLNSIISVATNSNNPLVTLGGSINFTYHFSDKIWANANYTFSKLITEHHASLNTVGFNIPDHRFNVGLRLRRIWKGLGFSANLRLHNDFVWHSRPGSIDIPWTSILDSQISYHVPKLHSTLRVGGSNILNTPYRNVAGGSSMASTFYASILFDLSVQ